jgi:hypothetical protein
MIPSINPVGYGEQKRLKWLTAVAFYSLSAAISSSLTGMLIASLGLLAHALSSMLFDLKWLWISILALLYCLHESRVIRMPSPQRKQQVPKGWRQRYHPWIAASAYGFVIGSGLLTRISVSTFYLFLLWCFLDANPLQAALVGAFYGLGQSCLLLLMGWKVESPEDAFQIGKDSWSLRLAVHKINAVFLGLVTLYSVWVLTLSS